MEKVKMDLNSKHSRVTGYPLKLEKYIFFIVKWHGKVYPQMLLLSKTGDVKIVYINLWIIDVYE